MRNEQRIERLEKEFEVMPCSSKPFSISDEELDQFRQITSAYIERFGTKYLNGMKLMPEPKDGDRLEIAKVLIFNSLKVRKALILLRHWAKLGISPEPEETWPEVLRNLNTEPEGRT
jgi:hypothetical protein